MKTDKQVTNTERRELEYQGDQDLLSMEGSWCKLMDGKIRSNFIHHFVSARFRRIIVRLERHIIPIKPFVSEDPDNWPGSNATFAYLAGAIHVFKNPQERVAH